MYWIFDGDIKDCTHPFCIALYVGELISMTYYSSERIITKQPIKFLYHTKSGYSMLYNRYKTIIEPIPILKDIEHRKSLDYIRQGGCDASLFTLEFYPLCEEMDKFKLKFAD